MSGWGASWGTSWGSSWSSTGTPLYAYPGDLAVAALVGAVAQGAVLGGRTGSILLGGPASATPAGWGVTGTSAPSASLAGFRGAVYSGAVPARTAQAIYTAKLPAAYARGGVVTLRRVVVALLRGSCSVSVTSRARLGAPWLNF